ncbi:hypothetical protein [Streptomyces harbinensis]|uniref:hypothetical protein n=1 Tax=Streptomyces harbinensis TaxID=1176198 RepID=UPI0034DE44EE
MNLAVRRIGRSLAIVLPVVLVLSGTMAITKVPWASTPSEALLLPASAEADTTAAAEGAEEKAAPAPEQVLQDHLVATLRKEDPSVALTALQEAVDREPSFAEHCMDIARALGRAAVEKYGSAVRAQQHARPVCDTSFATGVMELSPSWG